MRWSSSLRLFLSYLVLIAIVLVALSFGAESVLRGYLTESLRAELRRELLLTRALYDRSQTIDPRVFAERVARLIGRRVTVVLPSGEVVGDSRLDAGRLARLESHADRPEIRQAVEAGIGTDTRRSSTTGVEQLYVAARSETGVVLRLSVPLQEREVSLLVLQRNLAWAGGTGILAAALFSLVISVRLTRPLRVLSRTARAMARGDLRRRVRGRWAGELGEVSDALDHLAEQLRLRIAQLEGEREETRALIDSMTEGVVALERDGAVRQANPAARRMFRLPEPIGGIRPEAVSRRPEFLRLVSRALDGQPTPPIEFAHAGRSLYATAHPLPDGGAVLLFLDVSELRRLEGVRRDFVANASHELKTPLTAIRGYSETLLDEGLPPELRQRFTEVVRSNADRLQQIIDDLLDLSRIESGGWRADPEPLSVAAVAREAWSLVDEQARKRDVVLELRLSPEGQSVFADPSALRQIFANLFGNAVRYTSRGVVTLTTRTPPSHEATRSLVDAPTRSDAWVELEVRDTGAGIAAAHLPRIFERFYRVDPARSRAEGGTGLGLAIVRHLVESHGGRVWAESALGEGTSIGFVLPAVERVGGVTGVLPRRDKPSP